MARPKGSKSNPARHLVKFKQSEISRAIRAVVERGLSVDRVEVDPHSGKFCVMVTPVRASAESEEA